MSVGIAACYRRSLG